MTNTWKYTGPIFDAHTHIGTIDNISKMIAIEDDFGISAQIGIVHTEEGFQAAKERYPHRLVFAKYLSLSDIAQYNVEPVLDEISKLQEQGYSLAKSWFGPRWRDYYEAVPKDFRINHPKLDPIFQALEDNGIPLIIHMGDPDTYYASQYKDSEKHGTKRARRTTRDTSVTSSCSVDGEVSQCCGRYGIIEMDGPRVEQRHKEGSEVHTQVLR